MIILPTLAGLIGGFIMHLAYPGENEITSGNVIALIGISLGIFRAVYWWTKNPEDPKRDMDARTFF